MFPLARWRGAHSCGAFIQFAPCVLLARLAEDVLHPPMEKILVNEPGDAFGALLRGTLALHAAPWQLHVFTDRHLFLTTV